MNIRVLFVRRPVGWVDESCFRIESCDEPACGPGDVLVQALWLSLDPYLRGRMNEGSSYAPGFALDRPVVSRVVGRVIESRNERFAEGDHVWGFMDWALRSVAPRGEGLNLIDPALGRPSLAISALGMPGLTAWTGAIELGRPRPGDTVYISSAAGTIGQLAGQFAKRAGARVVGSAGSDDKVAYVLEHCAYDAAFNYKTRDIDDALHETCPDGIDVYLDNVGGATLEAALRHANVAARFPVCGMISTYNATEDPGIKGLQQLLWKRIEMTGFIVSDHLHKLAAYQARVAPWIRDGEIHFHEDIVHGIERAPAALIGMLKGEAIGKRLVQVA
ncbi:MAG: NADP-dependent oxidoreductase [Limnobacter sp.]|nr:NADP-dependent oxidoreductase [Limnobacter sp.]